MDQPTTTLCLACDGSGEVYDPENAEPVYDSYDGLRVGAVGGWMTCRDCNGVGEVADAG